MDEYLRSLERMIELAPKTLFPAHGPVVLESVAKLTEYRDHRLWREERIVEAWREGLRTPRAMVARVYEDVPAEVHPVAERQIEAHLVRLRRLGRIEA
jgi:glyoxylase-like metal-dependent hydrolase (beta-lactamase superfamily II)